MTLAAENVGNLTALRVRMVFADDVVPMTLDKIASRMMGIKAIWNVGYWIDWSSDVVGTGGLNAIDTRHLIQRELQVLRVTYNSPMEVVLGWPATAGTLFAAARGLIYLWKKWEEARVLHARAGYDIAALNLLKARLPKGVRAVDEDGQSMDTGSFKANSLLPTEEEVQQAGAQVIELTSISWDSDPAQGRQDDRR